jgi:hypothetical protein
MDVCGEPDELEASGSTEEEVIQRKVTIGSQNYTLVLRGTTLDISGEVHHSGWGGWTLSKDLTIKVFLSLREGTSRLSGLVIKSSPKFR